jgi:ABC-2 type transport system ATP-binding protein
MYVTEFLEFVSKVHQIDNPKSRIQEIIDITGLGKEKHKLIGSLSKGYKQRVGLAQALIHNPDVLILDEPTSGLDMNQLIDIRALIKNLGRDKTVIFSTHIMQEVNALCDRVIIINEGQIVADDSIDQLQNRIKGENLVKLIFLNNNFNENDFKTIAEIRKIEKNGNELRIFSDDSRDVRPDLFSICAKHNWVIIEMTQERLSVEYIFQKLTKN